MQLQDFGQQMTPQPKKSKSQQYPTPMPPVPTEKISTAILDSDLNSLQIWISNQQISPNAILNERGWTALHYAVKLEALEVVKLLLDNHADFTILTKNGRSILHFAVQCSDFAIA